ncbi:phosphoribosylformylglycinamidine synthase [Clostridium culturomicium]|uniref:phosphoribosylformylglycinamidine synthase n=1 Tax=Clostridium culturomicium TaxID=1499683 RepID=UPI002287017C|nr:phosphoribosylformylglycinamidine synthase [Clostridium culturomicium]
MDVSKIFTIFVEKKDQFNKEAQGLLWEFKNLLGIDNIQRVRLINKYDIDGIDEKELEAIKYTVLSEINTDDLYDETIDLSGSKSFLVEYHEGQYDQRADSAAQCIQLMTEKEAPTVKSGRLVAVYGDVSKEDMEKIKKYYINGVDSKESSMEKKISINVKQNQPKDVEIINGFIEMSVEELREFLTERSLSLNEGDIVLIRDHFKNLKRNPTITEIRVLDTYWSDHCRHTTFQRELQEIDFEEGKFMKPIKEGFEIYKKYRDEVYKDKERAMTLMDLAVIAMKKLRNDGKLDKLDQSEEINACSIKVNVDVNGTDEEYLLMFKNETHNHPTEIEPFGGASTCLGGAIRDPLSGRSYVFGAMRITGSGDPRVSIEETLNGKLPQRKITKEAAKGYSSYGNQIGLAAGYVKEVYDEGYIAKRMEVGAVLGAAPAKNVIRTVPAPGDVVVLVGGRTGRDGIGGASGSSKEHTENSIDECSSEVQKGNAPTERKIQRLFRKNKVTTLIKRCNDFGAGGVSVAIGELADGLEINLDLVKKKYEGLDGTEIAISESQERMAVVVEADNAERFISYCEEENLEAVVVAKVTEEKIMKMLWRGKEIVNLSREFLDTNGAKTFGNVKVQCPKEEENYFESIKKYDTLKDAFENVMQDINIGSQKGLMNIFDSSIGGNTVLMPYGGTTQRTQTEGMVFKIPVEEGDTSTTAVMAHGFNPKMAKWSPFHGAMYAVVESVAKVVALGGDLNSIYLSFQEYFERLGDDPEKWGKPFSALLGGLYAQHELEIAAIGGKDSMSGTFKGLTVPPTLISFAVTTGNINTAISNEFKEAGSKVVLVKTPQKDDYTIDFKEFKRNLSLVSEAIKEGKVLASATVAYGGIIETLAKMCFGNNVGLTINENLSLKELQRITYGSMVLEVSENFEVNNENIIVIGKTKETPCIERANEIVELNHISDIYENVLEDIFNKKYKGEVKHLEMKKEILESGKSESKIISPMIKIAKPKVLIPIFPGTNCEYDCERVFAKAGAEVDTVIFNNLTPRHIKEAIEAMERKISGSNIIMLPGGFSAGDEPDGSGKFINAILRNEKVKEAVMDLLNRRDGLILGICNGFQALIKLGLVPYGEIREIGEDSPTLTHNLIGSHQSTMVETKIVSTKSPWLSSCKVGDIHRVPISHGEGRFVGNEEFIRKLFENGQVATQYVDRSGNPTYDINFNPNGSVYAIEGITSPDGRVFGKMAHSERIGHGVIKNVPGNHDMKIFESGVNYFK